MDIPQSAIALSLTHRLSHLVMWVAFLAFHASLVCIFLLLVWVYNIDFHDAISPLRTMAQSLHLEATWQMLAFWGLSGSTILAIYIWAWRRIYWSFVSPYLFKTINAAAESP